MHWPTPKSKVKYSHSFANNSNINMLESLTKIPKHNIFVPEFCNISFVFWYRFLRHGNYKIASEFNFIILVPEKDLTLLWERWLFSMKLKYFSWTNRSILWDEAMKHVIESFRVRITVEAHQQYLKTEFKSCNKRYQRDFFIKTSRTTAGC